MSKEIKNKIVPTLRFPEFKNSKGWELKNLSEIALFYKGKGLPKSDIIANGKNKCIHYGELFTEYSEVINKVKNKTNLDDGFKSLSNDVLMPTSDVTPYGLAKACCVNLDGIILGGDILVIRTNSAEINGEFLSRQIRQRESNVLQLVTGSTVYHLYASAIGKLSICKPKDLLEQQKIADCLSSLDELITAQTQKLEALKAYKKGLMQQLFPAEGVTVPKLRFAEFRGSGEWEEKTLGEICRITSGGTPNRSSEQYWNGNIPWITTSLIDFNNVNAANEFITEDGLQNSSAKIFPKGTILLAMYGQGKTRGKVAILEIEAATNQACAAILLKDGYDINFVFQYLAFHYDSIRELSNRGGQENLSAGLIETIPITTPMISTKEQQKIASSLSSLDELITAQTEKIAALKMHKKGLMQGLFPAANSYKQ